MAKIEIGPIIKGVIQNVTEQALAAEAKKNSNSMEPADVQKIAPTVSTKVEKAVTDKVQDIVDNQTNNEPLWKSRVVRGLVGGMVTATATFAVGWYMEGEFPGKEITGAYVTFMGTQLYALYGRLTSSGTPAV